MTAGSESMSEALRRVREERDLLKAELASARAELERLRAELNGGEGR